MTLNTMLEVDITLDAENVEREAPSICQRAIPGWQGRDVSIETVTGGVTNLLYRCSVSKDSVSNGKDASNGKDNASNGKDNASNGKDNAPNGKDNASNSSASDEDGVPRHALVRIYGHGTETLIERHSEIDLLKLLERNGHGPPVFATFTNGYVYGFLEGERLSAEDLREGRYNNRIAAKMAAWHQQPGLDPVEPTVWRRMRQWLSLVPSSYDDPSKDKILQEYPIEKLRDEVSFLTTELLKIGSPIVFCHNDCFAFNLVYDPEKDLLHFIDYEYASYNPRAFDLANHFLEYAGYDLKYEECFPSSEQQLAFLHVYLAEFNKAEPTCQELHDLQVEVNKFTLCSHLLWSIWALVQMHISTIDFDYTNYASVRLKEYYRIRDQQLALV